MWAVAGRTLVLAAICGTDGSSTQPAGERSPGFHACPHACASGVCDTGRSARRVTLLCVLPLVQTEEKPFVSPDL